MIDKNNLKDLLKILGFQEDSTLFGKVFTKHFEQTNCFLKADFEKELLIYPEDKGLKVNERHTCNFSSNENFVVFECVHRLLEKGYKPEHLELEPKWKLGHGASGGRADILVKDNSLKSLMIIECKTEGKEFDDAWKDTQLNGGQLFSYVQQVRSTQFVCIYASDFADNEVKPYYYIITLKDNEKLLEEKKHMKPIAYKNAQELEDYLKAWKETYQQDYDTKGIFEEDIQPYHIGKEKYSEKDLKTIVEKDKQPKYHEFATILRQHNVSGRENAFDKLVNLFLCKIVDEKQNPLDLRFYWKGIAYDSFFDLIDRLQKLYKIGMDEFLGEEVTYVDNKEIDEVFSLFQGRPNAIQRKVKEHFRKQKYFTNNDFSFIDVHNEKLFYQNADILLKIVRMWQDIRLKGDQQNQFLGDMFEGFLDQGIKQSEGQFFTPMPVTKFILMSLPLENWIKENEQIPKAIDYACGAGHFLTELASQIKPFVSKYKDRDIKDYYAQIYGIEKEYRLSKVAKVSAFMYSQDDINVFYTDALATHEKIKDQAFSLLVANPPFSVKGFLQTLPEEERNRYVLTKTIEPKSLSDNNSIETFFIERAKQLLAPNGIAGIIVPSSVLSNSNRTYIAAREILLQYFDIVAITELGSGTFGKTGTNTVVLFLRRKTENPPPAEHYKNRVNDWFDNVQYSGKDDFDDQKPPFLDEYLIKKYCEHVSIPFEQYQTLLFGKPSAELAEHEMFKDYRKDFDNSTEIRNLRSKKFFKELSKEEKQTETDKRFLRYMLEIEKDKLYYFVLAYLNPQKVVIVKSPADNKEQKQFLGYEWSAAKGNEGIKLISDEKGRHLTPLYDPDNRYNPEKINCYIQQNFSGQDVDVPEILQTYLSTARLTDMLDFSRKNFDKHISLVPKTTLSIKEWSNKYLLKKLSEVSLINPSKSEIKNVDENTLVSFVEMTSVSDEGFIAHKEDRLLKDLKKGSYTYFRENDIIIAKITPCMENGKCAFAKGLTNSLAMGSSEFHVIRSDEEIILNKYVFALLNRQVVRKEAEINMTGSSGHRRVPASFYENYQIPLPPIDVQTQIVAGCDTIDAKVSQAQVQMEQTRKGIENKIRKIFESSPKDKILNLNILLKRGKPTKYGNSNIQVIKSGQARGYANFDFKEKYFASEDFMLDERKLQKGDILINSTGVGTAGRVTLFDLEGDFVADSHITIFRLNEKVLPKFALYSLAYIGFDTIEKMATGSTGQIELTLSIIQNIEIPIPDLSIQQALVAEIEKSEAVIATAQAVIDCAAVRKQAVLKKYL